METGSKLLEGRRDDQKCGLAWLYRAANKQFAPAQFWLGDILIHNRDYNSQFTTYAFPSPDEGLQWYRIAAEQNYGPALFAFSCLHLTDKLALVETDEVKAIEYFCRAKAEKEDEESTGLGEDTFQVTCAYNRQRFIVHYLTTEEEEFDLLYLDTLPEKYNCLMIMAEIGMNMILHDIYEDFLSDDIVEELGIVIVATIKKKY